MSPAATPPAPAIATPSPPSPGTPRQMRQFLVDFLRQELVGPDPSSPPRQPNGEEILTSEPPRHRYGAAILFPQAALAEQAAETDSAADLAGGAAPAEAGDDEGMVDPADEDQGDLDPAEVQEDPAEIGDDTTSLLNAWLPSAMGFSCLVRVPGRGLVVKVEAATYRSAPGTYQTAAGETRERLHYERVPLEAGPVPVPAADITGPGVRHSRHAVHKQDGAETGLEVRVVSRPGDEPDQRLLTVSLVNTLRSGGRPENDKCFFQVGLRLLAADGSACFLEYPERRGEALHPDGESMALLYSAQKTYAIGHGCSAEWDGDGAQVTSVRSEVLPTYELKPIVPTSLPGLELRMLQLSEPERTEETFATLAALADRYEEWIGRQQAIRDRADFPAHHGPAADRHLANCRRCLDRIRGGTALLREDETVLLAFQLANRAMLEQQLHYQMASEQRREWRAAGGEPGGGEAGPRPRRGRGRGRGAAGAAAAAVVPEIDPPQWPDPRNPPPNRGAWRPFQLAFLLMNLRSLAVPEDAERRVVDLIWFPTGGGKTEAYLGLTAFTIFLRRLRDPDNGGTAVLMRYTLRLLTTQQFQRAASLICACERLRRERDDLGETPITIGLWVGNAVTPRDGATAVQALNLLAQRRTYDNPFVLLNCPWCGAQMGAVEMGQSTLVLGYRQMPAPKTVIFRCHDQAHGCPFSGEEGLPLCVIDEDLYKAPPTLLLGTVDKFAMLPWQEKARALFGLGLDPAPEPPELIIQDELHLISGPLGSMVGHYETAIQELCSAGEGEGRIGPKVIASTATICRAAEQCHALYNCGPDNVFLFPPQCLRAGDSFFAEEDPAADGRLNVGVHASALTSHATAQVRTFAALLQAPPTATRDAALRDPYWTLIGYFNSLRELGHAATLLRADIREHLNALWARRGIRKENGNDPRRFINHDIELTSRMPNTRIPEALGELFERHGGAGSRPVDVCLATTMISVGVDVPRLGLMAVAGQPKTTSEYIQATSRVGRSAAGPGLVVTVYNPAKPRDRSHYERFRSYHAALYRWVEPTSVTPFAAPVRARALHALLVTLVRFWGTNQNREGPNPFPDAALLDEIRSLLRGRVEGVDEGEAERTLQLLEDRLRRWRNILPASYGRFGPPPPSIPLMYPAGSEPLPAWSDMALPTPTSMRNVDATCEACICRDYPGVEEASS